MSISAVWWRQAQCSRLPISSSLLARAPRPPSNAKSPRGKAHRPGTEDYLRAIAQTRPTLTDQALTDFAEDTEEYVRM
ncbi:hypothetical protein ACR6C2_05090 [Streptomyces sp. INA 01156]